MLIKLYIFDDIIVWSKDNIILLKQNIILNINNNNSNELLKNILELSNSKNYNSILVIKNGMYYCQDLINKLKNININKNFNILKLNESSNNINKKQSIDNLNTFILNLKNKFNNNIYSWIKPLFSTKSYSKDYNYLIKQYFTNNLLNIKKEHKFYTDNVYILYSTKEEYIRFKNYIKLSNFKINYTMFKSLKLDQYKYFKNKLFERDINKYTEWYNTFSKELLLNENQKSHIYSIIQIIEDAVLKNYNSITILEYDILFHKNLNNLITKYYNLIKKNDIIYLGSSQRYWINPIDNSYIDYKNNNYYKSNHSMGTFGIILKSNIFDIYINLLKKFILPSDVCLSILSKYSKSIVCFPNLVICDISKSTIKNDRNMNLTFQRFKWNIEDYKISLLNHFYDKIYVINLEKDKEKRRNILEQFNKYNIIFQFHKGIDGTNIKDSKLKNKKAYSYILKMINIFTDAKNNNYKNTLICDDDCLFIKDFENEINILKQINFNDFFIIKIGNTQHVWNNIDIKLAKENKYYYVPEYTDGSFAVGYNYKIFDDIINESNKFKTTFDSGTLREIYKKYPKKCISLYPNLIIADVSKSSISSDRNLIDIATKLKWNLNNYIYSKYLTIKVTIIITIYNKKKTIIESIKSIINQTYNNIELILVDDCSTDTSYDIVQEFIKKNNNYIPIKLLKTLKNSGCYVARNLAIKESSGDFISFQDGDDISLTTRIEKQLLDIINKKVDISFCGIYRLNDYYLKYSNNDNDILNLIDKEYNNQKWKFKTKLGIVTSIINKNIFNDFGLYREDKYHSSDLEFIERVFCLKYDINPYEINHIHNSISNNELGDFSYYSNELLYVCDKMNDNNISNIYKNEEKKQYEIEWKKNIFEKQNENIVTL